MTLTTTCPWLSILAAGLLPLAAASAPELKIPGISDVKRLVPVSVEGFNDEIAAAIRFYLEVAGFKVVASDQAMLRVSGTAGASLVGRVADANRNTLLNQKYDGGPARAQAHAFSDDIVALLPGRKGTGIAQTRIAFRVESGRNSDGNRSLLLCPGLPEGIEERDRSQNQEDQA